MNNKQIKEHLEKHFQDLGLHTKWDHQSERIDIHISGQNQPFEISIPALQQRIKNEKLQVEEAIRLVTEQVRIMMDSVQQRASILLSGKDRQVYPVIRSTSFPLETAQGVQLLSDEHTAESRIYYAVDLGKSYTLIDEEILTRSGWSKNELREKALFNLRGLPNEAKTDTVAGNTFYFISTTDGFAASRILNHALLQDYAQKVEGDYCLAIPHQDVLIVADLRNANGYDVLGQMTFHFYAKGTMPITALPFDYKDGKLEPIFILANKRPKK